MLLFNGIPLVQYSLTVSTLFEALFVRCTSSMIGTLATGFLMEIGDGSILEERTNVGASIPDAFFALLRVQLAEVRARGMAHGDIKPAM